jgi:D-alanine-D-alanine ligase
VLTDKRIGVLMGGISSEREISLRSGAAIYNALKRSGYIATCLDVGPDICNGLKKERIEIAFLALHGGQGENGSIQGMLEVLGIPYTGSGILASALAMDKEASKKIFLYHNIPVPPFVVLNKEHITKNSSFVSRPSSFVEFTLPWVVKPATEGSSVGVSIVRDEENFEQAAETAFFHGTRIIVEKYIEGKEIHIGILNGMVLGGVEVRPSLEFYNYKAKYTPGLTEYILPPEIDSETYEMTKAAAIYAHTALGCKGATRVDLKVDARGNPYVLEVNTIPGMTETSLLPKIASLAGFDFTALIEEIMKGVIDEGQ